MSMLGSPLRQALVAFGFVLAAALTCSAQTLDLFNAGATGLVNTIAIQPDGKILVGGNFTGLGVGCGPTTCTTTRNRIARLNPDGSIDAGFNPGADGQVYALTVQPDGKILVGGQFFNVGGGTGTTARRYLARLNADGTVDAGFNPGADSNVYAIVVQSDNRILVGGAFSTLGGGGTGTTARRRIGRINADGTLDAGFDPGANNTVYALAVQQDGSILVGGSITSLGGGGLGTTTRNRLGRVDINGVLDVSFDPGANLEVRALNVQANGQILVGGSFTQIGGGGTGTTARNFVARLESTGALDTAFNAAAIEPNGFGTVLSMAVQTDGKILLAGFFTGLGGQSRVSLGRINADSSLDAGFATSAVNNTINAVTVDQAGRVLVGGAFATNNSASRNRIARFTNTAAATQQVSVTGGGTTVNWTRSGTSPEVGRVTFEATTDGATWTPLGNGARVAGGWQLTGQSLSSNAVVRARGFVQAGNGNGSGSIVQSAFIPTGVNLVQNPSFASGTTGWLQFATPDLSYIVSNVTGGVFQFYRNAPPAGTSNQALIFRETGIPIPADGPVQATFKLGNTDNARKRISVLMHDSNFSDLAVCTFWLPANAAIQTYGMTTHSTQAWTSATISFYAASANAAGNTTGFYQLDDVSVEYAPLNAATTTVCTDPTNPTAPGGLDGPNLLVNGDFGTGSPAPWGTVFTITSQVVGGVFEFFRPAGTPAGVVLQATSAAMTSGEIITASFDLGNSSPVRKRVTVLIHDNDFSDLSACTFWLAPGQPLSTYIYRTFATKAWTNATFSVYPATVGTDQWIRLDNVSMQRSPGWVGVGVGCLEPGSANDVRPTVATAARAGVALPAVVPTPASSDVQPDTANDDAATLSITMGGWTGDGFAPSIEGGVQGWRAEVGSATRTLRLSDPIDLSGQTNARLTFRSWYTAASSRAAVEVSIDGVTWETVFVAQPSDTSMPVEVDLAGFIGHTIQVRLVLEATDATAQAPPDVWLVEDVRVESD